MSIIAILPHELCNSAKVSSLTRETINTRGNGAFVCQVSGDAAFVLGGGAADEGRVEDEAVLGRVATSLEGSV